MKRVLPVVFALAFAGTLLSGCDRDSANRPAGSGGTASSPSGSAGSSTEQPKKSPQTPSSPSGSSGSTSGSTPQKTK